MKKRVLSIALALLMVLALLPFGALAAEKEDFSAYEKLIGQLMYESKGTIYGTFFDFDNDGQSELIVIRPGFERYGPRVEIYSAAPSDHEGVYGYYNFNKLLETDFSKGNNQSEYLVAIVENSKGEAGVLLELMGTETGSDNSQYKGLVCSFTYDNLFVLRDGQFRQSDTVSATMWTTPEDKNGNSYYYPDLSSFSVNNRDMSLSEFSSWYERFSKSLTFYVVLSASEELEGFNEEQLLSLAKTGFYDVHYNQYFAEPVKWAAANGITNGTSDYEFSPANPCTRGQVVTFLWRAAGCPEPESTKNPFKDVKKDAYYYKAVLWAVEQGITNGTSETTFSPGDPCTRGQVVTFMYRNAGSPKISAKNPFKDVKSGAYFYDAVLWAVKSEITNGTSKNEFSPAQTCTRGQIVTFLYRGLAEK